MLTQALSWITPPPPLFIKDDKWDYVGNSKQDYVVLGCVVADSFEDDQCSNDAEKWGKGLNGLVNQLLTCEWPASTC